MDRFKGFRFRKIVTIIFLFLLFASCSNYVNTRIVVLDAKGNELFDYELIIVGYLNKKVNNLNDSYIRLLKKEYLIRVIKDGFFTYEGKFDLNREREIKIVINDVDDIKNKIKESFKREIINLKRFSITFLGKNNGLEINFNAFFDLNENIIKVSSDVLEKEITIKKIDLNYYYNEEELPEEVKGYFGEIINIINSSVIFIKDLPTKIDNLEFKISKGYVIVKFNKENSNLEIHGFTILDGVNFKFISQYLYIKTIDEMNRIGDFNLYFINE